MFFIKKLLILILLAIFITDLCSETEYIEIPSSSIRMRVIAKSNSTKDQQDKKTVKKELVNKLSTLIEKDST